MQVPQDFLGLQCTSGCLRPEYDLELNIPLVLNNNCSLKTSRCLRRTLWNLKCACSPFTSQEKRWLQFWQRAVGFFFMACYINCPPWCFDCLLLQRKCLGLSGSCCIFRLSFGGSIAWALRDGRQRLIHRENPSINTSAPCAFPRLRISIKRHLIDVLMDNAIGCAIWNALWTCFAVRLSSVQVGSYYPQIQDLWVPPNPHGLSGGKGNGTNQPLLPCKSPIVKVVSLPWHSA